MGPWCAQMGVGGWAGMAALWLLVIALVVWGLARLFPGRPADDARSALDGRLARGEIDPEAYRLIREELDAPSSVSPVSSAPRSSPTRPRPGG